MFMYVACVMFAYKLFVFVYVCILHYPTNKPNKSTPLIKKQQIINLAI